MGLDLPELWRARRYKYLLAIVERLPRDSNYVSELADDDELAEQMPPGESVPRPPSLAEFGPVVEHLAAVRDLLSVLVALESTPPGKKPQQPRPVQRPVTAALRRQKRAGDELVRRLESRLFPEREGR